MLGVSGLASGPRNLGEVSDLFKVCSSFLFSITTISMLFQVPNDDNCCMKSMNIFVDIMKIRSKSKNKNVPE